VRSGLQQIAAFDLKTCITVRKDHPLAKRASVRVADLVDQNFIMPDADSLLRQVLTAMFAKVAVKPVSTITSNSFEFIATMVAGGFGIGCQVRLATGPDPVRPNILYVPIRDPAVKTAVLACCVRDEGTPSMAVSLCVQELRGALETWCKEVAASAT
jgi:DNA-binding transcriptional LysR family regulator